MTKYGIINLIKWTTDNNNNGNLENGTVQAIVNQLHGTITYAVRVVAFRKRLNIEL
jgi:hypothetical protein